MSVSYRKQKILVQAMHTFKETSSVESANCTILIQKEAVHGS
jgi:hypothetical protein